MSSRSTSDLHHEKSDPNLTPPVSRSEVHEVFESWRNSSTKSLDSGLGQASSSGQSIAKAQIKPLGATRKQTKKKPAAASLAVSMGDSSPERQSPDNKSRLPKIAPRNKAQGSRQSMQHGVVAPLLNSPPGQGGQQTSQNTEERRRFITVVRPWSFFPEPALPPNFNLAILTNNNKTDDPFTSPSMPTKGRPPSPAPFNRRPTRPSNLSLAGQGVGNSATIKVNLAGGSGWDLTAIRKGYNTVGSQPPRSNNPKPVMDRSQYQGQRYPPQNGVVTEDQISMPPWNPHFGYSKVLSQQNLPLTDDWRRHIDARRKALQRRRSRRRGVADGGINGGANGERQPHQSGAVQTEGNFEELLRRAGDVESSVQTDAAIESRKRKPGEQPNVKQDGTTQVVIDELPEFEASLLPHVESLVNQTLEQSFVEILEEEELKEIRRKRMQYQQMKTAELTTSRLMDIAETLE